MIEAKIIDEIKKNRCILFLGPLMTALRFKGKRTSLSELVCDHITETLVTNNVIADGSEMRKNPYYAMAKYIKYLGRTQFEENFEAERSQFLERPSAVYSLLSKIPFNTIINFGADHFMEKALRRGGYEFQFAYYDYSGEYQQYLKDADDENQVLDDKTQLVYNLLGSIYEPHSQVLTESDQLEYMRQIAGSKKIPDNVLSRIKDDEEGKSYIFLGFNFEEWPFRFLLDLLQLSKAKSAASPKLRNYNIAVMTQEFYQERFGLQFLNATPEEFALELSSQYKSVRFDHKYGYLSYDDADTAVVEAFKESLQPSGLNKRITFWDKSGIVPSDVRREEMEKNLSIATIYIAFITSKFINNPALKAEMKEMLAKPNVMVFPVITKKCDYQTQFPDLKRKASLVLPSLTGVLVSSLKEAEDEDYVAMIKKINSRIR